MDKLKDWELKPEEKIAACNKAWEDICDGKSSADFLADAAVKKFMQYIDEHSHDEAQTWGSPVYRKCIALPVWKKVEQEVGL